MGRRIGIDLGTTNSVVAVVDMGEERENCSTFGRVTVLADDVGRTVHASVLCDCDGEIVYGEDAKYKAAEGYAPVRFWKRHMGRGITFPLKGREYRPQDLSRELLVHLKHIAAEALRDGVDGAVITHPAYFGGDAIAATREAGDEAELNVGEDGLMMEPIAAALAYLHDDPKPDATIRVLVYDLGGGTFDVSVLERSNGVFRPLSFDGDPELGGYNFDKVLAAYLLEHLRKQNYVINIDPDKPELDPRWAALMHLAEEAKIYQFGRAGSGGLKADIRKPRVFEDDSEPSKSVQLAVTVTRKQFEEMIAPLVDRTIECCRRVLEKAKLTIHQIDRTILVGGSSRLDIVQRRLREEFGRDFELDENMADLCVAIGAAIYAGSGAREQNGFVLDPVPPVDTSAPQIFIAGRVKAADAARDVKGCMVTLTHDGKEQSIVSDGEGKLFFRVKLTPNAANQFDLRAVATDGAEIAHHNFVVNQRPEAGRSLQDGGRVGGIPTYLAKNLYVETVDGLSLIEEEGRPLPIDILVDDLETAGGENTVVEVDLYQEDQHLVQIRLDNFTAPVSEGTPVEVVVHVGKDYSMHAKATIPSVGATAEVRDIKIPAPPRPSVQKLREDFARLRAEVQEFLMSVPPGDEKIRLGGQAEKLCSEIETLLDDPAPDAYRIQRLLKNLERLKSVRPDAFSPPRPEMNELFSKARRLLRQAEENDESLRQQELGRTLDVLEEEANAAYENRDTQRWKGVAAGVKEICRTLEGAVSGPSAPPPAPVLAQMLLQLVSDLKEDAQKNGKINDPAVKQALKESLDELKKIDLNGANAQMELIAVYKGPISRLQELVTGEAPAEGLKGLRRRRR